MLLSKEIKVEVCRCMLGKEPISLLCQRRFSHLLPESCPAYLLSLLKQTVKVWGQSSLSMANAEHHYYQATVMFCTSVLRTDLNPLKITHMGIFIVKTTEPHACSKTLSQCKSLMALHIEIKLKWTEWHQSFQYCSISLTTLIDIVQTDRHRKHQTTGMFCTSVQGTDLSRLKRFFSKNHRSYELKINSLLKKTLSDSLPVASALEKRHFRGASTWDHVLLKAQQKFLHLIKDILSSPLSASKGAVHDSQPIHFFVKCNEWLLTVPMGNKHSGSDWAIQTSSQSTNCFRSTEGRGITWFDWLLSSINNRIHPNRGLSF